MSDPKPDESSDQQSTADETNQTGRKAAADEADADKNMLKSRKRISREEVYDEYGHISGYSDIGGFSNLQFVFTVEEDAEDDDDEDDESAAEGDAVTDIISRQQGTKDSTSAESDRATTDE